MDTKLLAKLVGELVKERDKINKKESDQLNGVKEEIKKVIHRMYEVSDTAMPILGTGVHDFYADISGSRENVNLSSSPFNSHVIVNGKLISSGTDHSESFYARNYESALRHLEIVRQIEPQFEKYIIDELSSANKRLEDKKNSL